MSGIPKAERHWTMQALKDERERLLKEIARLQTVVTAARAALPRLEMMVAADQSWCYDRELEGWFEAYKAALDAEG